MTDLSGRFSIFSHLSIPVNKGARRSALAASDVHDVLVPLYMSKQARYTRDTPEMRQRCTRDASEMRPRYTRDAREMHARCTRGMRVQDAAKDALAKTLRVVISNEARISSTHQHFTIGGFRT